MGDNWAITIDINNYHHLQRLNYAKQDAKAIQFFLQELNIQTVYHFTDYFPVIL